jgi:hypothetical protein
VATLALLNAYIYGGGHDFTGDSNEVRMTATGQQRDVTTFRSNGWSESIIGLREPQMTAKGFWQSGDADAVDPELWGNLGVGGNVFTVGDAETEGVSAYFYRAFHGDYHPFTGALGDVAGFDLNASGSDGVGIVGGQLALKKTTVTTTGAKGTALNLGLIGSGQYLYATLHLLGTAGSSITALVESDEDNTFGSATTRIAFGAQTTAGGFWGTRLAGPIADDDWFRLRVSAISGSWSVACAIGIR